MNLTNPLSTLSLVLLACTSAACSAETGDPSRGPDGASGSSAGASNDAHPAWLVGPGYTKGYKTENNIAFESDDVGIRFGGAPDFNYEEKLGKKWSKSGTWKLQGTKLVLGTSETIDLTTAMKANCRILQRSGKPAFFTGTRVEGCPFAKPLSAAECKKAGTYSHSETSGSSSSSFSSSTSYLLDVDGVLVTTTSTSRSTCYGSTCKSLYNAPAPVVGRWWLEGSSVRTDGSKALDVSKMDFSKTEDKCGK